MVKYDLLSNFDIEELCREFKIPLIACIPKDILKQYKFKDGGFIINLDDSDQNGSHWVSLYIKNNDCCYFDSFGIQPPVDILRFCKGKNLIINKDQLQKLNQESCGFYSIAFLHFMNKAKGSNLRTNLFLFTKPYDLESTKNNDHILQIYLRQLIK